MTKKKRKMTQMPMTQFVRFSMDVMGADGIEVKYPFGWVSAPHLVNLESIPERMEYLMGFVDFYEDFISFNGDTQVIPIEYVQNGHFSTLESVEIPDFSNGKEYFTDAGFSKLLEWCEEYKRQMDEGDSDDDEEGNTVR